MSFRVDIEIVLKEYCSDRKTLINLVERYLKTQNVSKNSIITTFESKDGQLPQFIDVVKTVIVGDVSGWDKSLLDFTNLKIDWYVYSLDDQQPTTQSQADEDGKEEVVISTQLTLPSIYLTNIWENLYYDNDIKNNLLKYAQTMIEFSDKGVDCNVVSCNRVILLHGPPGTGKTSLCKALAQKLTIRMYERFSAGILIEINSHSLFSKWFSESGKLVNKMFSEIKEIVENKDLFLCLLIDEVESLAHARDKCVSGSEPSDSIRVVNALLTQIDQIKMYPNILILTTSNMTDTIDLAFVDRADVKQFLGLPTVAAIYKIYHSCIIELMKAQIVKKQDIEGIDKVVNVVNGMSTVVSLIWNICEKSVGLSGRALRKIPFLARALFLNESPVSLTEFLLAMEKAVQKEFSEREYFKAQPVKNSNKTSV